MNENKVVSFYDDFVESQKKTQINERIYSLYKRTLSYGLNNQSNVLELGSGIGTVTYLLSKTVKKGIIETVEISPKSVEFAKKNIKKKNIRFVNDDVVTYTPTLKSIDFITLFDVIEHIPIEKHADLFKNITSYMGDNTLLLINIPNPEHIELNQKYHPEVLQIIDQPIHLSFLVQNLEQNNLSISYYKKYSIWLENDYIFYAIEKKKEFKEIKLSDKRSFIEKVGKKLLRYKIKLFHNYC
tara:strand:+ start:1892 stop:2614 length:723 start_codon:yes stop_codon:yes gene_type:complete